MLRRLQIRSAGEHGEPREGRLLAWRQQAMAPRERGAQGTLALGHVAHRRAQRIQAVGDEGRELRRRDEADSPGRQLDGERQAVNAAADLCDRGCVAGARREGRVLGAGGRDEQRGRRCPHELLGVRRLRRRQLERTDLEDELGTQPQRFTAGGQHREPERAREQLRDQRRGSEQVLDVVEDKQQLLGVEGSCQRLAVTRRHADRVGDRRSDVGCDPERRQSHPRGRLFVATPTGEFDGEPRLADAAEADQGDEPDVRIRQQCLQALDVCGSADQW